ncbi:MAG TPA: methionyl-tRNA formyltransferase [Thermodesulfobacteriota bacterium]|nr:methionyl-tRNA formyltransferase [Thermodesulfobacteriota bacterium]
MKILFVGTAEFACPSLEALLGSSHELLGAVTQPDRPRGRGQKTLSPPVKTLAAKAGLPVFQPEKIRDGFFVKTLESLAPDLMVVVAYGQILSASVLAVPKNGTVNVHGSLLPKYRGAAPIARAILEGESRTGVTTMLLDPGMDTGPILLMEETEISEEDTAGTLHDRLARIGADLLLRTIEGLASRIVTPRAQDHAQATYAPKIEKAEARIDWNLPGRRIFNLVRAFDPHPGAFTTRSGRVLKLFRPILVGSGPGKEPGTVVETSPEGLTIAVTEGKITVRELQAEGRPRMPAANFLRGNPIPPGVRLGD